MKSSWLSSSSQKSLLKGPSSIYQTSLCSMIVARKVTQPAPGSGAVQFTWISLLAVSLVCVTTLPQMSLVNVSSSLTFKVPCLTGEKSLEIKSNFLNRNYETDCEQFYFREHCRDIGLLFNGQEKSGKCWPRSISTSNRVAVPLKENCIDRKKSPSTRIQSDIFYCFEFHWSK